MVAARDLQLGTTDALLALNVQRDFCPGGAVAVPESEGMVPILNLWMNAAEQAKAIVIAARDWHPPNHMSFMGHGGQWPPHCVWGTAGADFHPQLEFPRGTVRVWMGVKADSDPRSAFDDTGLAEFLERRQARRLFVAGLALEHCVRETVLESLSRGLETYVIVDAALPLDPSVRVRFLEEMRRSGVILLQQDE